jgi:hypothetical protein
MEQEQFDKIVQLLEINNRLLSQLINNSPKAAATAGSASAKPQGNVTKYNHEEHTVKIVEGKFPPKRTAKGNATIYRGEMFIGERKVYTSVYISDEHAAGKTFEPETILTIKGRLQLDDRGFYTLWTDQLVMDDDHAAAKADADVDVASEMEDVPF